MATAKDHSGKRFGRLEVLRRAPMERNSYGQIKVVWVCKCDCGAETTARSDALVSGKTRSCGCLHREAAREQCAKIGLDTMRNRAKPVTGREPLHFNGLWFLAVKCVDRFELTLLDKEDAFRLAGFCWTINTSGYADTMIENNVKLRMHHAVLGMPPKGMHTDHINRVRLDNRRCNLRFVTPRENRNNRGKPESLTDLGL